MPVYLTPDDTLYAAPERRSPHDTRMDGPRPGRWYVAQARDDGTGEWVADPNLYARAVARARTDAHNRIKAAHAEALRDARERYSETEREGWGELVEDAKAGAGAVIEGYAAELGISVEDAAARILHAREGYRQVYGAATGKLARLRDQVDAAETVEELEAIQWPG